MNEPTRVVRLGFLDALRAVAAVMVMIEHFRGSARLERLQYHYVSLGIAGVLTFFLCSGFIIPRSIERTRNLRVFWANRVARLWPAYLVTLVLVLLVTKVWTSGFSDPIEFTPASITTNLTMLAGFQGTPWIDQSWTLTYELVFYALITALAAATLLRRSEVLAGLSLGGTFFVAVAPHLSDHPYIWRSTYWIATMFVGLVVHDAFEGRLPAIAAWVALAAGAGTGVASLALSGHADVFSSSIRWSFLVGYGVFAAGYALRRRPFPAALRRLGVVSYSLYLTHKLVIYFVPDTGIGWVSALIWSLSAWAVAEVGFRFIERPAMALSRRGRLARA